MTRRVATGWEQLSLKRELHPVPLQPRIITSKGCPHRAPFLFAIQDNAIFLFNRNYCFYLYNAIFFLFFVLPYHGNKIIPICPIKAPVRVTYALPVCVAILSRQKFSIFTFQFEQPPFYVPSTWVLCAFFEIPLSTTKPTICLFYAKPLENQPNSPSRPLAPFTP